MEKKCGQCGTMFYADVDWKKICIDCWKKNKNIRTSSNFSNQSIDQDMLKILIRLCHPDKHGNSGMSNKATTFLLNMRK